MNWSKVKSIMIVFLILVNLSFLTYIVYEEVRTNKRNEQMAETVTMLLQSRGITVDKKLVAKSASTENADSLYADNFISNYESFAKTALGETATKIDTNKFKSELGTLLFKGDCFEIKALDKKNLYISKITKVNAQGVAKEYLTKLGIDTKNAKKEIVEENSLFKVKFYENINELPVFNSGIEIIMNSTGIVWVSGNWYNVNSKNSSISELKNVSGILVDYMNSGKKSEITNIELGYSIHDTNTYHESVFLTPVWKITDASGVTYIDAREAN